MTTKTTSDNGIAVKVAYTLQESGVYPYPEFVKPLVKLAEELVAQGRSDGVTDTIDRMVAMTSSKPFGQWKPADVSAFFEAMGDLEREVKQAAATPVEKEADK